MHSVKDLVVYRVRRQVKDLVVAQVHDTGQVGRQVWDQVGRQVWDQVWKEMQ